VSDDHAIRDLLPGYALGCLDAEDERAVTSHLPRCPVCRTELESFVRVADQLTTTVPGVEPPADLELRLMRVIGAGRQKRSGTWRPALTAVAAMFAVVLVAGNLLQWTGVIQRPGKQGSPALMSTTLAGTGDVRDAYGTVVLDPADHEGVLAVTGLPRLDSAHQYQLWLIRGGERRSAGVFSVDAKGYGSLLLVVPVDFRNFHGFGISIEPSGGSPAPTGPRVMAGTL
jgi:anti-sigma-K factor RskA